LAPNGVDSASMSTDGVAAVAAVAAVVDDDDDDDDDVRCAPFTVDDVAIVDVDAPCCFV